MMWYTFASAGTPWMPKQLMKEGKGREREREDGKGETAVTLPSGRIRF